MNANKNATARCFLRWWRWLTTKLSLAKCLDTNWTTQGKWLKGETQPWTVMLGRSAWNAANWRDVFGYPQAQCSWNSQ